MTFSVPNSANAKIGKRFYIRPLKRPTTGGLVLPIYIASTGNDTTGTGAIDAPYATLAKALTVATAGSVIKLKTDITLPNTGLYAGITISTDGLTIASDTPGTRRTFNMAAMDSNSTTGGEGFRITASGVTLRDLRFTAYQPEFSGTPADYVTGVNLRGTNGTVTNCEFDTVSGRGFTSGEGGSASGLRVTNCDFHTCRDPDSSSPYGNADGAQVFCEPAENDIIFDSCRFYDNSDDGIDLFFAEGGITLRNCWAFRNGYRADGTTIGGDGTGFKLGGTTYDAAHIIEDCLSFLNAGGGISANDNNGAIICRRNTCIDNGVAANAYPAAFIFDGTGAAVLTDNVYIGDYGNYFGVNVVQSYNAWNTPPGLGAINSGWFGANFRATTNMDGARQSDGNLRIDLNYGRPALSSVLLTNGSTGGKIGWTSLALEAAAAASAAFTYVGSSGAPAGSTSGNTTLADVTGAASGDLMVAVIARRGTAAHTTPSGWTKHEGQDSGDTGVDLSTNIAGIEVYSIVRGGSAPALTWNRTGGDVSRGVIVAYRPASGTIATVASSSATEASATTTPATGTIATDVANCLLVGAFAGADNMPSAPSNLRALTEPTTGTGTTELTTDPSTSWKLRRQGGTTNGADTAVLVGDAVKSTAGATGSVTLTCGVSARHAMAVVAFKAV